MRTGVRRGSVTLAVLALLVAGGVVVTRWANEREEQRRCDALGAEVEGVDAIHWDNGITSTEANWINALADGVEHADAPTRAALADALRDDLDGFRAARDALGDESDEGAADRLRAMLMDPDGPQARRTDDAIQLDISTVRRAASECGFV